MPAAGELLVFRPVAAPAVQGGDVASQLEVVVVVRFPPLERLMAFETGDVGAAMLAPLELVDDRGSLAPVALRTPPRRSHQFGPRLPDLRFEPGVVDQQRPQQQAAADGNGNQDRPEGHSLAKNGANPVLNFNTARRSRLSHDGRWLRPTLAFTRPTRWCNRQFCRGSR